MKITKKDINTIINTIITGYQPEKIYLFGSYASGNASEQSDIDLLIIKSTTEKTNKRAMHIHQLFNPYIYNLDVIVYTPDEFESSKDMINTLAYFVNKDGKIVYESRI